jgi:hypothetical protein
MRGEEEDNGFTPVVDFDNSSRDLGLTFGRGRI